MKNNFLALLVGICIEVTIHIGKGCEQWEFRCQSSGTCLKATGRCNGRVECTDGSDELRCPTDSGEDNSYAKWTTAPCSNRHFQCSNSKCVYNKWVCDGENDCGDNTDEFGCGRNGGHHSELSLGAVVGISLACSVVLLLLMCTLAYMLYHRFKNQHIRRPAQDPIQEITDIMGGVPYHMPREALLRVPPPQYTSQTNLAIVRENAGFVPDEIHTPNDLLQIPPPLYSSRPDLSLAIHQNVSDPPPMYSSRQDLQEVGISQSSQISHASVRNATRNLGLNNPRLQSLRRPRGRVSRVRNSIPVLSSLATYARASLPRSRNSSRRNSNNRRRRSNNTNNEQFYFTKPLAIQQQESRNQYVQNSTRPLSEGASVNTDGEVVTALNDQISHQSNETALSIQYTEQNSHDVNHQDNKVQQDKALVDQCDTSSKTMKALSPAMKLKLNRYTTDELTAQNLLTKCKSVPELAIKTELYLDVNTKADGQKNIISENKKEDSVVCVVDVNNWKENGDSKEITTFNGKKSHSLNYLLDVGFTLM